MPDIVFHNSVWTSSNIVRCCIAFYNDNHQVIEASRSYGLLPRTPPNSWFCAAILTTIIPVVWSGIRRVCLSLVCVTCIYMRLRPRRHNDQNSDLPIRSFLVQPLPPRTADIIDHMFSLRCKHTQSDGGRYLQVTTVPKLPI